MKIYLQKPASIHQKKRYVRQNMAPIQDAINTTEKLECANRFDEINFSTTQIQSKDSWTCGYFCVHFLYSQCLGVDFENFLDQYSSDFDQNDCKVLDFVDSIL